MTKSRSILDYIGNTPLVSLSSINPNKGVEILGKLEYFNPGGSIKDRPALHMIEEAEKTGELTKDKIILESTSGNTGIGLAMVAAIKGYRILLIMSEAVSEERMKILKALGAELEFTPAHLGTDGAIEYGYNLIRENPDKYWLADQFNNEANWMAHYTGTSEEIWTQTGGELSAIVATMGTTGTLMGISRRFKELDPNVQIIGVEPYLGHKIQGLKNMKESYRPGIFEKSRADKIINIEDEEAFGTTRLLAMKEGLFVGMSSGAAMAVALKMASEMESGRIVVILPDGGERYLSTPLFMAKKRSGLFVFNTLHRKKEEFIPIHENHVKMYSCGPTLCQEIDLGQCRRLIFSDLIRRYMEFKGYEVEHVMNVTDLDDRTIQGAQEAGLSLREFTDRYYDIFMKDLDDLNIKKATAYPRASEHVEETIQLTEKLLEKGYAYEKLRSIYFDISRLKEYGDLSSIDLEKIQVGKTVDLDQYEKDNPRDFTLLKRSTLNELKRGIFFQTKWGNIRPGWHMECSAMAMKYLGPNYDIHTSGVELIFPHHENAIAISRAVSGNAPANYWMHNEPVMANGGKESELSTAPPLTLKDLLQHGYTAREVRYWLIGRHYRKPSYFSKKKLLSARNTLSHLDKFIQKLHYAKPVGDNPDIDQAVYAIRHKFMESMDDDFSIAPALAALFQFTSRMNKIMDQSGLSPSDREKAMEALRQIDSVLGIMNLEPDEIGQEVEEMIRSREKARKAGNWEMADRLRKKLLEIGIEVNDTKQGTVWNRVG